MTLEDERPAALSASGYGDEDDDRSWPGIVKLVLGALLIAGVVGLVWYAYNLGLRNGSESVAPIIQAGDGPIKEAPDDPGGLDVPNQDMDVYDTIEGEGGIERYVPPPPPQQAEGSAEQATPDQADKPAEEASPESAEPAVEAEAEPEAEVEPGSEAPPAEEEDAPQVASVPPTEEADPMIIEEPSPTTAELIGPYRIQLAAFRSPEEATQTWLKLQKSHNDLLGPFDLVIQKIDLGEPKGVFYRLQAAPLKSREAAESLCGDLVDRQVSCIVVKS